MGVTYWLVEAFGFGERRYLRNALSTIQMATVELKESIHAQGKYEEVIIQKKITNTTLSLFLLDLT